MIPLEWCFTARRNGRERGSEPPYGIASSQKSR